MRGNLGQTSKLISDFGWMKFVGLGLGFLSVGSINYFGYVSVLPRELRSLADSGFIVPHFFEFTVYSAASIVFARYIAIHIPAMLRMASESVRIRSVSSGSLKFRYIRLVNTIVQRRWRQTEPILVSFAALLVFGMLYFDTSTFLVFSLSATVFALPAFGWPLSTIRFVPTQSRSQFASVLLQLALTSLLLYFSALAFVSGKLRMNMNFKEVVSVELGETALSDVYLISATSSGILYTHEMPLSLGFPRGVATIHFVSFSGDVRISATHKY